MGSAGKSVHEHVEQEFEPLIGVLGAEVLGGGGEVGEALAWQCGNVRPGGLVRRLLGRRLPALAGLVDREPVDDRDQQLVTGDRQRVGESRAPRGGPLGEGYSKREVGAELIALMCRLGHTRFAVVGHDRGARVAYRMALDHPDRVSRACVLNIVPTVEQFEALDADSALEFWPFALLAQPFAEELLAAGGEPVVRHILATWPAAPIEPERYVRAFL